MTNEHYISQIAHEADMARAERTQRRLWILCIILIGILLATNGAWIWYESQFEDVVVTQESDAKDGGTAIVNNGGDVTYGESTTDN